MGEVFKCIYGHECGNCRYLNKEYKYSLSKKLEYVNSCFKKEDINFNIDEIVPSPKTLGYRNKMIIGFKNIKGNIIAGFFEEGSHRIVDMENCQLHSDTQNKIFLGVKRLIKKMHFDVYDEDKGIGVIRYLVIREAFATNEVMVTLVTATKEFPGCKNLVKEILKLSPNIKTIVQNINGRHTSIVLGNEIKVLYGPGFIFDYIGDIKFKLTPKSFFQVNPMQAKNIYDLVAETVSSINPINVVDAYSGVATIASYVSKYAKTVLAVENNKEACDSALGNIKYNNLSNITVINKDATKFLVEEGKNKKVYDTIIMDPPRTGSTIEFIDSISKVKAKNVIYVSCGPDTLARDLKEFIRLGYKIDFAKCFDMFCFSEHVETVMRLYLKEGKQ